MSAIRMAEIVVQGFSADDVAVDAHTYEPIVCTACKGTHMVNPATGVVLGASGDQIGAQSGKPPGRSV